MNALYQVTGVSKQSFHQWMDRSLARYEEQEQLLVLLKQLRVDHPRMSCRKFYKMLSPTYMGRNHFETFCYKHGFKVELKKRYWVKTTDSSGVIRFPNRLLSLNELSCVNQLWVSDITYYNLSGRFYYLTFIMDVYNREVLGGTVSDNLGTRSTTLPVLKKAIRKRNLPTDSGLILHSDGGGQYYSKEFTRFTEKYGIVNSMGRNAYENPYAERINGIIKNEYLIPYQPQNIDQLKKMLEKAIYLYNNVRPHDSLDMQSPILFQQKIDERIINKTWIVNKKIGQQKQRINISIK